jgi:hypothetical protein
MVLGLEAVGAFSGFGGFGGFGACGSRSVTVAISGSIPFSFAFGSLASYPSRLAWPTSAAFQPGYCPVQCYSQPRVQIVRLTGAHQASKPLGQLIGPRHLRVLLAQRGDLRPLAVLQRRSVPDQE